MFVFFYLIYSEKYFLRGRILFYNIDFNCYVGFYYMKVS